MMFNIPQDFNNAAKRQPARRFEMETGLTGIAGRYAYPEGFSASEFEDYYTWYFSTPIRHPGVVIEKDLPDRGIVEKSTASGIDAILAETTAAFHAELQDAWAKLVALNPELSKVDADITRTNECYHAIFGVTSGFNVDDINFFIGAIRQGKLPGLFSKTFPDMNEMRNNAEAETGAGIYWVASRETLKLITQKIADRKAGPSL